MKKQTEKILGIIAIVLVILLLNYKSIKNYINDYTNSDKNKTAINNCMEINRTGADNQTESKLEYDCAMETAAKMYNQEPDKAINLCMQYLPSFVSADDAEGQKIRKMSCQTIIEKRLKSIQ